jgi:hypothetical protein
VSPTSVSNPDIDVTLDLTGAPHRRLPADFQGINTAAWSAIPKNQEAIPVVKRSGIRALRYPGGGMADEYQWDLNNWYPGSEPGDLTSPEHLKSFGDGVSASALITVNVRTRDADYAAGWVADAKKKGNAWKLWEVGNEYDLAGITEDEYVTRFNEYAAKMKRADPNIMVGGPVGTNAYFWEYPDGRLAQFMKGCGNRLGSGQVDFVSLHWYPGGPEDPNTAEILAAPQDWERNLNQINAIVARYDNRKLPVYITEWNAVPYGPGVFTISVANALFTADLLAEFARTGLAGSFFWDIENGSPEVGSDGTKGTYGYLDPSGLAPYPSYYAHWMFSRLGSAFYVPNQNVARDSVASIWAGKRGDGTLAILAINKTASAKKVRVSLRGFCPEGQARRYVLSGTSALDTKPTLNGITMPKDVSAVPAQLVSVGTVFGTELPPWSASLVELPAK